MDWEKKTQMCLLLNSEQDEKALDIVIENIDTMDKQAWDMFFTGITLIPSVIYPLIDKHRIIFNKIKDVLKEDDCTSFRTALRFALYKETITNDLELENYLTQQK